MEVAAKKQLDGFSHTVSVDFRDNIPRRGPVIFTINHANQFMDAVMVLCTCQQKISYLMAEASWQRRIIGDIAWALVSAIRVSPLFSLSA